MALRILRSTADNQDMRHGVISEQTIPLETPQDSMAEQLCVLYAEREILEARFPGMSIPDVIEVLTGVRLINTAEHLPSSEAADSLEAQLIEMYADRQALAEAFPGMSIDEIANLRTALKAAA